MRFLAVLILLFCSYTPAPAQPLGNGFNAGFQVIGRGCTTFAFIDFDCDGCGNGVYASGTYTVVGTPVAGNNPTGYQITTNPPTNPTATPQPFYSVSDTPDADDTDPTVCTTAQWQAKWGTTNAGMISFLEAKKGLTAGQLANIYYISLTGNNGTAVVNDPAHPYLTPAPIMTILSTKVGGVYPGGVIIARGATLSGQGTISGGVLTVTTAPSPNNLGPGQLITMSGVPVGTYISSGTGPYTLGNSSGLTIPTVSSATAFTASWGYTLNFNPFNLQATNYGSNYVSGNPGFSISGSTGKPVYIMAYPGEIVQSSAAFISGSGGAPPPFPNVCCVTIDGLKFWNDKYDTGIGAIVTEKTANITVINNEFVGWDKIYFGDHSVDDVVYDNVFHDIYAHAVYFSYSAYPACAALYYPMDINFALDAINYANGKSCGASYRARIVDNVIYNSGTQGFDPLHINTFMDAAVVTGNIVSYAGGSPLGMQTGNYNGFYSGNLLFDSGTSCWTMFGSAWNPAHHNHNTIANNVCWVSSPSDTIRSSQPAGGFVSFGSVSTVVNCGTITATGCTLVSAWPGLTNIIQIILSTGQVIPVANVTLNSTAVTWPSTTITGTPSAFITEEAIGYWNKNTLFQNNVVVTTDNGSSVAALPFQYSWYSYPETDTIHSNTFWSIGNTSNRTMFIDPQTITTLTPGTYTFTQMQALSSNYTGNTYANPNFPAASEALLTTPGAFNFGKYNLK